MKYIITAIVSISTSLFLSACLLKIIYERILRHIGKMWEVIKTIDLKTKSK